LGKYIGEMVGEMKKQSPENYFIDFIKSLEGRDFGSNEKTDFLKNEYENIITFYKNRLIENED